MPILINSHFPVILSFPRINITRNGGGQCCQAQVTDMIAELRHETRLSFSDSEAESVSDSDSE